MSQEARVDGGIREQTGLLMADEDAQVTDEKVGQIQKQQQQNPSTTTAESFPASTLDPELHTCVTRRFYSCTEENRVHTTRKCVFVNMCVCLQSSTVQPDLD